MYFRAPLSCTVYDAAEIRNVFNINVHIIRSAPINGLEYHTNPQWHPLIRRLANLLIEWVQDPSSRAGFYILAPAVRIHTNEWFGPIPGLLSEYSHLVLREVG